MFCADKEQFYITTDSGHLVSFVEPPESPPSALFVCPPFQEIPFVAKAVRISIGKGCFAVVTQSFAPTPISLSKTRYDKDIDNVWDFFSTGDISDVMFLLPNGREVLAHKAILASRSPSFAALFEAEPLPVKGFKGRLEYTGVSDFGQSIYEVKGWSHLPFTKILRFLYTNKIESVDKKQLAELMEIATSLNVPDFRGCTLPTDRFFFFLFSFFFSFLVSFVDVEVSLPVATQHQSGPFQALCGRGHLLTLFPAVLSRREADLG